MGEPPAVRVECLTVDCRDPERMATFWAALLAYEPRESFTASIRIGPASGGGVDLLFAPGAGAEPVGNRLHLDLRPADRRRTVARALELGARVVAGDEPTARWTVLADPEGNEFCVLQSETDYAAFAAAARANGTVIEE